MPSLVAICKEGKSAVRNAVNKLIDMGYLVRTQLKSNESMSNGFEFIYRFSDVPVSKDEADEIDAETRRMAITVREGGRAKRVESVEKSAVSSSFTPEKQETENLYTDAPCAELPSAENQGQYNKKQNNKKINYFVINPLSFLLHRKPKLSTAEVLKNRMME